MFNIYLPMTDQVTGINERSGAAPSTYNLLGDFNMDLIKWFNLIHSTTATERQEKIDSKL